MQSNLDRRDFLAAMAAVAAAKVMPIGGCLPLAHAAELIPGLAESAHIEYGADYYAEDWPAERIEADAKLMQSANFRTVRLIDTNWERLQPEEGRYDFAWLDRVLEILNRVGIRAVLCTSSYVPPAWLIEKHADFYLVNEAGARRRWGGMGFLCLNHPLYRAAVAELVAALTNHYGQHRGVIGWQIDNEMGQWGAECYDETYCQPRFQQYLKDKFRTIDELNQRLLTVSYGHSYSDWKQVLLRSDITENALQAPLVLESKRFFSANLAGFLTFQADLLRQQTSGQFITHNGPVLSRNCFAFAKPLDFLSEDNYPSVGHYTAPAFNSDLMRGFNHGKSFQALEIRSGTLGAYTLGDATPPPGLARLWAWQRLAHGADGLFWFRWRMNNGGSEQYWQGLLNYDGTPSMAFPEVVRMGAELQKLGSSFLRAETPSFVAEILSYDSLWALEIAPRPFPYMDHLRLYSTAFRKWSMNVDFVEPVADLSKYKVVVAPALHVVDAKIVQNLESFVTAGGVLILGPRSGFKNQDNLATELPPGPLTHMAGVSVQGMTILEPALHQNLAGFANEDGAYRPSPDNAIRSASPEWQGEYKAMEWVDMLDPLHAKPLFSYAKDFYAGKAAVTVADFGKGKVVYVGTLLEPRFYADLAQRACAWAKIEVGPELPEGVDFAVRQKGKRTFRFLLNFSDTAKTIRLASPGRDLLSDKSFQSQVTVPPLELCVLASEET